MTDEKKMPEERIADAMERIADELQKMNAVRVWPVVTPSGGTGGTGAMGGTCPTCGTWVPLGATHYCSTVAR